MKYSVGLRSYFRLLAKSGNGYSLVELLVVVVVIGIISLALTSFLSTQLFESLRFEKASRETDDASRVQHLLDTEVSESDDVLYPGSVTVPAVCGAGDLVFALDIPNQYNVATGLPNYYRTYYLTGASGGITRCGKPVVATGALDFASSDVSSSISSNISLEVVASGSGAEVLEYRLSSLNGRILVDGRAYGQAEAIR
ncbi:prepilin-type N-terminal cleavage/methylation domain-containing protein [Cyanobium sp. A2C-AMD]|uniref:prepilin-type N-terminal cleavage/methylation domain-containing protein n=1 Tax=Cyanobium sp. A2C-AMD TaxID=2823695 RepID=UPI0020CE5D8E|nr:prepilin-type N-terminal cleavage/methylation domain-containing protein [Cyanobium sp. A2C-AMD]MCP9777001.1 prepilin-type N-terminal cleavage/methylation domain-containing protein [Cyanobium sp. Tous-M-B4]MCP9875267.1 prepilin-type N-terminal cleavage/methylation domain-containing protein [Cyanobium sp. A2C-AMD]